MTYKELLKTVEQKIAENPVAPGSGMDQKTIARYWVFATLPIKPECVAEIIRDRPDLWEKHPWYQRDNLTVLAHGTIQKAICRDLGVELDRWDAPEDHTESEETRND